MEVIAKLTVETSTSKKSGKPYTALYATFKDGQKVLISFNADACMAVMARSNQK